VFPPTKNPWNADRVAGGSSTGPAVAVAAWLTPFDVAGDTRGSIQCPAAFCGVFGMRPTEHRVPLTGTIFIDPIRKFRVLTTSGRRRPSSLCCFHRSAVVPWWSSQWGSTRTACRSASS
jgi:Amidase